MMPINRSFQIFVSDFIDKTIKVSRSCYIMEQTYESLTNKDNTFSNDLLAAIAQKRKDIKSSLYEASLEDIRSEISRNIVVQQSIFNNSVSSGVDVLNIDNIIRSLEYNFSKKKKLQGYFYCDPKRL